LPWSVRLGSVAVVPSADEQYDRAVDCVAEGNLEAAEAAYRQALELDPEFADAWEGLSMVLADLGRFDAAIAAAERVVALRPEELLSYTNISRIYQKSGDVPRAEEWAAKGRMLDWKQQLKNDKPGGA